MSDGKDGTWSAEPDYRIHFTEIIQGLHYGTKPNRFETFTFPRAWDRVSGSSERANKHARDPVLTFPFMAVLNHSGLRELN